MNFSEKKKLPESAFTIEFHFEDCLESNPDIINAALEHYALSDLELVNHRGTLCTETTTHLHTGEKTTRRWYCLDACILHCTPATEEDCFHYQLSTMALPKDTRDCIEAWRELHPDRIMRTSIEMKYGETPVILVLHHERKN